jgi:Dyp-type peroxidase family
MLEPPTPGEAQPVDADEEPQSGAQVPLTLAMPVVLERLLALKKAIEDVPHEPFKEALDRTEIVHFTRFGILEGPGWARLVVIATFDGELEGYVDAMVHALGMDTISRFADYIEDPPESFDRAALLGYVQRHNLRPANGRSFRAYPGLDVSAVRKATDGLPAAFGRDPQVGGGVQLPLLLVMPVKTTRIEALKDGIGDLNRPELSPEPALRMVGTVHSTRFVIFEGRETNGEGWAKLAVVATFDGNVDDYIAVFARQLKFQFNLLFSFIADAPANGANDVPAFVEYVKERNIRPIGPVYRAYAGQTTLDIDSAVRRDLRRGGATPVAHDVPAFVPYNPEPVPLTPADLDDIQGLIIRGYARAVAACHLLLRIESPAGFRAVLADLTHETPLTGPYITVATHWTMKEPIGEVATSCVNIGFTYAGLEALELSSGSLESFPRSFRAGAAARAAAVGDIDPDCWIDSLKSAELHALVSVYSNTDRELADVVAQLAARMAGAATVLDRLAAHRLADRDVEHFGYPDGISQPTIDGAPRTRYEDPFPPVAPGEFVLGHSTQRPQSWDPPPTPDELGRNGSFAAFRMMEQDVPAFERFLSDESSRLGIDPELLAAKLCGRWRRTGEPLVLRPTAADPPVARERLNMFDYESTDRFEGSDDHVGRLCPRGAHIRRGFPRSERVADDGRGFGRRLVRRAMPYGPPYSRHDPGARQERGLLGHFICASLENQFEYLLRNWINNGLFTAGLGTTTDPMTGPSASTLAIPGDTEARSVDGVSRFVTTRGCAYLFLPSMTALRYLARDPASR